jgi:hypothetical protein
MTQLFANNAVGVLAQDVASDATALTLSSGNGNRFPQPANGDYALATLIGVNANGQESQWEIVKITNRTGDVLTVERGQEDTEAAEWQAGARLEQRLTRGTLENLQVLFPLAVNKGGTGQNAAGADGTVLSGDSQSPSGTSWKTPPTPQAFAAEGDTYPLEVGSVISGLAFTDLLPAAGNAVSISSDFFTLSRDADGNIDLTVGGDTQRIYTVSNGWWLSFSFTGIAYGIFGVSLKFDTPQTITAISGTADELASACFATGKAGVVAADDARALRLAMLSPATVLAAVDVPDEDYVNIYFKGNLVKAGTNIFYLDPTTLEIQGFFSFSASAYDATKDATVWQTVKSDFHDSIYVLYDASRYPSPIQTGTMPLWKYVLGKVELPENQLNASVVEFRTLNYGDPKFTTDTDVNTYINDTGYLLYIDVNGRIAYGDTVNLILIDGDSSYLLDTVKKEVDTGAGYCDTYYLKGFIPIGASFQFTVTRSEANSATNIYSGILIKIG